MKVLLVLWAADRLLSLGRREVEEVDDYEYAVESVDTRLPSDPASVPMTPAPPAGPWQSILGEVLMILVHPERKRARSSAKKEAPIREDTSSSEVLDHSSAAAAPSAGANPIAGEHPVIHCHARLQRAPYAA